MTRTLNEITQDIAKYHEALNLAGGEVAAAAAALGMTEDEFTAAYDKLAFEDASKLDGYVFKIEESKAKEAAAQAMVDQWEERIKTWRAAVKEEQRTQEWMKARLKFNMEVKGETKITTESGRVISVQKNGGKAPLIIDEEIFNALDDDELTVLELEGYVVLQPVANKEAIRTGCVLGSSLVSSFARIGEQGTHIRIK